MPSLIVILRCPDPTTRAWFNCTSGKAKRGAGAEAPKGPARSNSVINSWVAALGISAASRRKSRGPADPAPCAASRVVRAFIAGSSWISESESPAAILCPPPFSIAPVIASLWMLAPRSTPGTERAEPLPAPDSNPMTTAGRLNRSFRRAATMPTTPGCQPSPAAIRTPVSGLLSSCFCASTVACSRMALSTALRSSLCACRRSAKAIASLRSSVARSFAARHGSPPRPPAFTRGPVGAP